MTNSTPKSDSFLLERFVAAQENVYRTACAELRAGQKQSHWMWYVFPQMKRLGFSPTSRAYGIGSMAEAQAYLQHPILGPRLIEVTNLVLEHRDLSLRQIFGSPDDLKFRSSMTLFAQVGRPDGVFRKALDAFCDGVPDERTLALLANA
jgi:uncharacterized protein (DUF1810 family)